MKYNLTVGSDGLRNPVDLAIPPATESEVLALEKILQARLPQDYQIFLKTVNGGMINSLNSFYFYGEKQELPPEELIFDYLFTLNEEFVNEVSPSTK